MIHSDRCVDWSLQIAAAHSDAIWGALWTHTDAVLTASADGTIKQWDAASGQLSRAQPAHTHGLVSLDVNPTGTRALYNSLEGLTTLWSLESGEVEGTFESYARSGDEQVEPCEYDPHSLSTGREPYPSACKDTDCSPPQHGPSR